MGAEKTRQPLARCTPIWPACSIVSMMPRSAVPLAVSAHSLVGGVSHGRKPLLRGGERPIPVKPHIPSYSVLWRRKPGLPDDHRSEGRGVVGVCAVHAS